LLFVAGNGLTLAQNSGTEPGVDTAGIERGRQLAGIGNCAACHTIDAERPYSGGRPIDTPCGTIYSSNITPDAEMGIGSWTQQDFDRSMRQGISADGSHLYPAFPYTHYTLVRDDDLAAIYAYLMSREASNYEPPANTLRFPFRLRSLQAGWKLMFFDDRRWQPQADKSDLWNRGAYLAEGLGHCGACHTPRNAFGAERADDAYNGARIGGWYAPALNAEHDTPLAWSEDAVFAYLRQGGSKLHGVALGSMSEVVHQGLGEASDEDLRALAVYFSDLSRVDAEAQPTAAGIIAASQQKSAGATGHGEQLYLAACASCHFNPPDNPSARRPELSLNSSVTGPDPINLIRATLEGVTLEEGIPGINMPGFDAAFSDADLVDLLTYLRSTSSAAQAWPELPKTVSEFRRQSATGDPD